MPHSVPGDPKPEPDHAAPRPRPAKEAVARTSRGRRTRPRAAGGEAAPRRRRQRQSPWQAALHHLPVRETAVGAGIIAIALAAYAAGGLIGRIETVTTGFERRAGATLAQLEACAAPNFNVDLARSALDAVIEHRADDDQDRIRRQKIFAAAYADERGRLRDGLSRLDCGRARATYFDLLTR